MDPRKAGKLETHTIKALFADVKQAEQAFHSFAQRVDWTDDERPEFYSALRKMLTNHKVEKLGFFLKRRVVTCAFYNLNKQESAIARAVLKDAGALEVTME